MSDDIPSSDPCNLVNPKLWKRFMFCYQNIWGPAEKTLEASPWSEEEVVQWLDTRYEYLLNYINKNTNRSLNGG